MFELCSGPLSMNHGWYKSISLASLHVHSDDTYLLFFFFENIRKSLGLSTYAILQ